jgi:hypothetical protein
MSSVLERLRSGRRWWLAEVVVRLAGAGLLAAFWRCARIAQHWIATPTPHGATPGEFGICAVAFALLTTGLALGLEGPGLFRLVPIPKHSAFFALDRG